MKQTLLGLILVGATLTRVHAAPGAPAERREPGEIAETFLQQVAKGEVDAAYDGLPKGSAWEPKKLDYLRGQTKAGLGLYGAYLGIEKVKERQYTPSVVRFVYVMKFEQHFLVWNLVFYKAHDRWETSSVAFLDQVSALE